jgi:Bacterial extracellular solute-binding protein, family 7
MKRSLHIVLAAALAAITSPTDVYAQEAKLLFTSMSPAGSENSVFFAQWAQRVADQSKGAVKIDIRDGGTLANFSNVYDRVRDDVVQVGWAIHQVIGGRFPLSEVAGVPFLATGGPEASVALWRSYKTGKLDAEYKDAVPLFYAVLPPAYIHFAKKPNSIDSLVGLKVAVSGRLPSALVTELGGTPISMNTGEMYETLQRGTVLLGRFLAVQAARGHDLSRRGPARAGDQHVLHVAPPLRRASRRRAQGHRREFGGGDDVCLRRLLPEAGAHVTRATGRDDAAHDCRAQSRSVGEVGGEGSAAGQAMGQGSTRRGGGARGLSSDLHKPHPEITELGPLQRRHASRPSVHRFESNTNTARIVAMRAGLVGKQ